jgi:hypothetical protein
MSSARRREPLAVRVREAFVPIAYAQTIEAAWRNLPLLNGRAFESPAACPDSETHGAGRCRGETAAYRDTEGWP